MKDSYGLNKKKKEFRKVHLNNLLKVKKKNKILIKETSLKITLNEMKIILRIK